MTAIEQLQRLNFGDLLSVTHPAVEGYTFDDYHRNNSRHPAITAYCVSCETNGWHQSHDDPAFCLTNISHGAHSSDFFRALTSPPNRAGWHEAPVMFVYETPSRSCGIYHEIPFGRYRKRPAKEWYWIHGKRKPLTYPEGFRSKNYSEFVLSAMLTFRLANVYMTNLVKCGMNNPSGKFKPLKSFQSECVRNCYERYLKRELEIFKPVIVFAVGAATENWLRTFCESTWLIQQLPHPAWRSLRNEHFKVLYFWLVLKGLRDADIVTREEYAEQAEVFYRDF